jgi:outer membrane protein TolC
MSFHISIFLSAVCIVFLPLSVLAAEKSEEAAVGGDNQEVLSLDRVIGRALEHNLGLATERFRVANAEDEIEIEEAAFDIELFGSTDYGESLSPARTSSLDDADAPESETRRATVGAEKLLSTGASVTVDSGIRRRWSNNNAARNPDYASDMGVSIRQPLLQGAGRRINLAPLARARISAEISLYEFRSDVLDLLRETEAAYWDLAYARADRGLIASSIELAENLLAENKERERLGLATPLEVLQAETELNDREEDLIQAERVIAEAEDRLRRLMGDTSFLTPVEGSVTVRKLPEDLPGLRPMPEVVRDTIESDAEADARELGLEVRRINTILAKDATKPDVSLVAGLTYLGRNTDGETSYRGAYGRDGQDWNVGLQLRVPWGTRAAKARLRQAERELERDQMALYDLKQEKALAARSGWRAVQAGLRRIEVTRKALELNREAFEQQRARYSSGVVAYRTVLEAQRDFDAARRNQLSALIETLQAQVELSRIDATILPRNGFDWEQVDQLSIPANVEPHPLRDAIETDS